jgi:hypothetical protein
MGENPWYLMENRTPHLSENFDARVNTSLSMAPLLLGKADNLSENFDARVNISLSMAPLTFASFQQFEHFSFTFIDAEDYAYAASETWPKVFISILFKTQISNEIVAQW